MAKMAYIKGAAEAVGLSEYQLRRFTKEGKCRVLMSGRRYIYNLELLEEDLERLAAENLKRAEEDPREYGVLRKVGER